jgi:hypothetical protein
MFPKFENLLNYSIFNDIEKEIRSKSNVSLVGGLRYGRDVPKRTKVNKYFFSFLL